MDKEPKITVRINNKEITPDIEKKMPHIDFSPPSQKIIDFAKKREEKRNIKPFWDDGNHENIPKIPPNDRKKKRRQWQKFSLKNLPLSLIAAALSAIIVGVSLGVTMLTLFTGDKSSENVERTASAASVNEGGRLPALESYIVQGGAFSQLEKAKHLTTTLQDRGQAAVLVSNTKNYYVFIGIAGTKEEAEKMSQEFRKNGMDTYVKRHTVHGIDAKIPLETAAIVNEGIKYYEQLVTSTANALMEKKEIDAALLDEVFEWAKQSEGKGKHIEDFTLHIQKTAEYLKQYQASQDRLLLSLAQQKLMEALASYEQLVDAANKGAMENDDSEKL